MNARKLFFGLTVVCAIALILFFTNAITYGKLFGNNIIMNVVGCVVSVAGIMIFYRIYESMPKMYKKLPDDPSAKPFFEPRL